MQQEQHGLAQHIGVTARRVQMVPIPGAVNQVIQALRQGVDVDAGIAAAARNLDQKLARFGGVGEIARQADFIVDLHALAVAGERNEDGHPFRMLPGKTLPISKPQAGNFG